MTWPELYDDAVGGFSHGLWDTGDDRTADLPLVASPLPPLLTALAYFLFCRNARALTRGLPVLPVRTSMVIYNLAMVVVSAWMLFESMDAAWLGDYWSSLRCPPLVAPTPERDRRIVRVTYVYYLSKYVELADTLFFVARKRYEYLTNLHVFHHGVMPWVAFIACKWFPGGLALINPTLNGAVHTLMYLYYGLAALGLHRYLFWKRYMTAAQLLQFAIGLSYCVYMMFIVAPDDCYGRTTMITFRALLSPLIIIGCALTAFFVHFYVVTYTWRRNNTSARRLQSTPPTQGNAIGAQAAKCSGFVNPCMSSSVLTLQNVE